MAPEPGGRRPRPGGRVMGHLDMAHRFVAERARQMAVKGYDVAHDDRHEDGDLLYASLAYICSPGNSVWPFDPERFKPSPDPIRNIEKAGALLAAEGDRLIRRAMKGLPVHGGLV